VPLDKLAVVTGASRGLGREIALALAREGYDLLVCARGSKDLAAIQVEILALGAGCKTWQGDLTDGADPVFGRTPVAVMVNNAAFPPHLKSLEELTDQDLVQTFALNVFVPFRLMRAVIPGMKARGSGTIVNICSLAGRRAIKNVSLYCASKFALRGLTESVAQELEGTGVKCFSASPGGMKTSMREQIFHDAAQQQDPAVVARIIVDAIAGRRPVPQGGDLVIRGGEYAVVLPERWPGIKIAHEQEVRYEIRPHP
jgi:NAD(P)-dependent dehydrogenase (short-subunit alcohol dehydrogenase family)